MPTPTYFWFRRDLRVRDNAGLYAALTAGGPVVPVFIFDRHILDLLEDRDDARVTFLHDRVGALAKEIAELGGKLLIAHGTPETVWGELLGAHPGADVYANRDYEPYALERDGAVRAIVEDGGGAFETRKDHVIFELDEVEKKAGGMYTVFTPYSRTWIAKLDTRPSTDADGARVSYYLKAYPTRRYASGFASPADAPDGYALPALAEMGFRRSPVEIPGDDPAEALLRRYDETRDYPAVEGTSRLGVHLRHGTVSIRAWARRALSINETFLSELIWRDFYSQVLQGHPHVVKRSFRPEYDEIEWVNDEALFERWCAGTTGYPLVDAGMRQLNATGYMHNRVRMVTASFLTKHLLTDWRWGEAYFARKLLDYDLASNNGGWQWAAGSGTDASPYFRVFNPTSQLKKFDRELAYTREWVPEYGSDDYPEPIVEHAAARDRAIAAYKAGLARGRN